MLLGDIANVNTGLVLSRKKAEVSFEKKATYKLITLRNITEDGLISTASLEEFDSNDELDSHYFTQKGDILMRLSEPNTAVLVGEEHENLLVPSYFVVIKVEDPNYLPAYVAWYLNTGEVKKSLERSQSGTTILSTNQRIIKALEIKEMSLEQQQNITAIWQLHQKEKLLYRKLIDEKERWFKEITKQIINQ